MPLIARRRDKPLDQLSDRDLHRRVDNARKIIEGLPDRPPHAELARHHATLDAAAQDRAAAQAELDRREQAEKASLHATFHRRVQASQRTVHVKALDLVAAFGHAELAGAKLNPSRLDDTEAKELLALARRRRGDHEQGGPLIEDAERRYIELVEQAAAEPGRFGRKQAEAVEREKFAALEAAAVRDPRRESITAAVLGDPGIYDWLRTKLREVAAGPDEVGRWQPERTVTGEVLTPDHVASLFTLVHALHENGGAVVVTEHGALQGAHLERGLPFLPQGSLGQLIRTGLIAMSQTAEGRQVTYGPETRRIAEHWGITVPTADD